VGALYDRLTAMPTLVRAFDRVEENRGCAGADGETDRVRWYPLCGPCRGRVVQQGEGAIPEEEGFFLV
jgi:hypothetical protein